MPPWRKIFNPEKQELPARYLRKEFISSKRPGRAMAYICGLGLYELYVDGKKIGDHVLSPALTEYDKRVFYVTYDVTDNIKIGKNAVGVILGNGRFFAPRLRTPTETRNYGYPGLLFKLRIEYVDGSIYEILSDESWKITDNGPIEKNNEYDGELYNAKITPKRKCQDGVNQDLMTENGKVLRL